MKRKRLIAFALALVFYASILPWRSLDAACVQFYDFCAEDLIVKSSPWVDVRAHGAVGDGVTDDTAAIQAALAVATANTYTNHIVLFPPGKYKTTAEIVVPSNAILQGSGVWTSSGYGLGTQIFGQHTDNAVLNLAGKNYVTIKDMLITTHATTAPKTTILLGRTSAASAGNHNFYNVSAMGYSTVATVYDIASELNNWWGGEIRNQATGTKYAYYTSQSNNLSVGTLTGASNIVKDFWGTRFYNESTDAAASTIYIAGGIATGYIHFHSGYLTAKAKMFVTIETGSTDAGDLSGGPILFDRVGGELESGGTADYAFYFVSASSKVIKNVSLVNCNIAGYDNGYIGHSNAAMTLTNLDVVATPNKSSVFPNLIASRITLLDNSITINSNALDSFITYDGSKGTLTGGDSAAYGNTIHDINAHSRVLSGTTAIGTAGTATTAMRWAVAASTADNTAITHGVGAAPTAVICTASVATETCQVTTIGATTFTVRLTKHDGTAGTSQTVYWIALK